MRSDKFGTPELLANHFAVNAIPENESGEKIGGVNALDYNGCWKLFDGLCMAVFAEDMDAKRSALRE